MKGLQSNEQYKLERLNLAKITSVAQTDYESPNGILAGCRTFGKVRSHMFRFKQPFALLEFQGTLESTKRAAAKLNRKGWSTVVHWMGATFIADEATGGTNQENNSPEDVPYSFAFEEEGKREKEKYLPRPRPATTATITHLTQASSVEESYLHSKYLENGTAQVTINGGDQNNSLDTDDGNGYSGVIDVPLPGLGLQSSDTSSVSPTGSISSSTDDSVNMHLTNRASRNTMWSAYMSKVPCEMSATEFWQKVVQPTGGERFFLMCLAGSSHAYVQYPTREAYVLAAKHVRQDTELGIAHVTRIPKGEVRIGSLGADCKQSTRSESEILESLERTKYLVSPLAFAAWVSSRVV